MRAILLLVALLVAPASAPEAAWQDAPGCAQRVEEARDATRSFYRYYGQMDAQAAEALVRLDAIRASLRPARQACTGEQEQRVLAWQQQELALIERDIRSSAPWGGGERLTVVEVR